VAPKHRQWVRLRVEDHIEAALQRLGLQLSMSVRILRINHDAEYSPFALCE
jgi:hypothetical protein